MGREVNISYSSWPCRDDEAEPCSWTPSIHTQPRHTHTHTHTLAQTKLAGFVLAVFSDTQRYHLKSPVTFFWARAEICRARNDECVVDVVVPSTNAVARSLLGASC